MTNEAISICAEASELERIFFIFELRFQSFVKTEKARSLIFTSSAHIFPEKSSANKVNMALIFLVVWAIRLLEATPCRVPTLTTGLG